MRQLIALALLMAGGLLAWALAARLSSDALGMALGMVFGLLAGLPALLLMLAANRRAPMTLDAWQDDAHPVCPVRCLLPEDFGPDDFDPDEEDDWVIEDEAPTAQISQTHYHYHAAPAALPEGEQSIVVVMQPKQLTGGKR